jgi:L-threonylcarbamoyladenylate synthase
MFISIKEAANFLRNEEVVAIPTETVYGLAGRIDSETALKKIFSTKERPFFDPLIVHINSIEMAKKYTNHWDETCEKLAQAFWPGPLTMIVKKNDSINPIITSGLESVGLRIPDHSMTLDLIETLNIPLAAPSANKFKKTSPTCASHVEDEFGKDFPIIDGGRTQFGIESTVAGIFEDRIEIYRPGIITREEIQEVVNIPVEYKQSPVAPGQLEHHYMPNVPITVSFSKEYMQDPSYQNFYIWQLEDDPSLVARELYYNFRKAQENNHAGILLILDSKFKQDEKWLGILNRIDKAKTYEI